MPYPKEESLEFNHFIRKESLRNDGSNFMTWYRNLKDVLYQNDISYVIGEFLGDGPGNFASAEAKEDFRQRRDIWDSVQITMYVCMDHELKNEFLHMEPIVMIDALKVPFLNQMKHEQYKQLDKFLSLQMEEHTCLETHLCKMFDIHDDLTNTCGYWMADHFAIQTVLRSLPPSYEELVDEYILKSDFLLFNDFLVEIKDVEVEPIEGEIDDTQGIFDIQVIIVISYTWLNYKYLMLMSCFIQTAPEYNKIAAEYDMMLRNDGKTK